MRYRLKIALKKQGITLRELSRRTGESPSRLSRLIWRRIRLRHSDIRKISGVLGVRASRLFPELRRQRRRRRRGVQK